VSKFPPHFPLLNRSDNLGSAGTGKVRKNQQDKLHLAIRIMMRLTVPSAQRIPQAPRRVTILNPYLPPRTRQQTSTSLTTAYRTFHNSPTHHQASSTSPNSQSPNPHTNFYKTHGRALFKALTLAFFTYQVCYWAWLVLETEEIKDQKRREIKSLEGEVRLLNEGKSQLPKGRHG
jgi:hypothetical protein